MGSETADYSALNGTELADAESAASAEFTALYDTGENITADKLAELTVIGERVNAIRAEIASRREMGARAAELRDMVNVAPEQPVDDEPEVEGTPAVVEPEPELVSAAAVINERPKVDVRDVIKSGNRLNASLAAAAQFAPATPTVGGPRWESVLVASADIPGFTQGGRIADVATLTDAMHKRARMLPDHSNEVPIASLQRDFRFTLNDRSSQDDINAVLREAADPSVLTAAGGFCAPSEISYDFYNIICESGILDIPTVGINRGGLQYPTSPSFGDVVGQLFTWNETQDIAAVTGTAQSGVKTCYRVACPAYNNVRLACTGLCITMGNLMDSAFPELVANQLQLLTAMRAHATNAAVIAQLVAGSTSVTYDTVTGHGLAAPLLEAVEMQVEDYRIKYRMCDDAILEAVLPSWILPMFRADLAKRLGLAEFDVSNGRIAAWFSDRSVRVQFVQDWQVGAAGQLGQADASTSWPTTVQFLLYAAGTWIRGNGLNLDLGVIRDSTLNSTNDFTLAWMEECYLTALIGHESRVVTVPICPNGATQVGITMGCNL